MDINKSREIRFSFLKRVYELTKGDIYSSVSMWDIGQEINLSRDETSVVTEYLTGEGFVKPFALGGQISITHDGIKEIENVLSPLPKKEDNGSISIINVKEMHNSQIQQATNNSSQTSKPVYVTTLNEKRKSGYISGAISLVICAIFTIMVFQFGWDLTGQILTAFSALFGILGIGSLIKPESIGQITTQLFKNIDENYK